MVPCAHVWNTPLISLLAVTEKQKLAVSHGAEASAGRESHSIVRLRGGGKQRTEGLTVPPSHRQREGLLQPDKLSRNLGITKYDFLRNTSSMICGITLYLGNQLHP